MRWLSSALVLGLLALTGCTHHHQAQVVAAPLPPPPTAMVPHTGRLWVELEGTPDKQCTRPPGERALCFAGLAESLGTSIEETLWPAFPHVRVKRKGDNVEPGDYLLHVTLAMQPLPADARGPGWSAGARGEWKLVRDGLPLASEGFASRSRADFPFGRSLGAAASEVISAVAVHVASVVGGLPEVRPEPGPALPAVASERRSGPLFTAHAVEAQAREGSGRCQSSDDAKRCSMASR